MKLDRQSWEVPRGRKPVTLAPEPATKPAFLERAMIGRMQPEDQAYMARALLQLSDENAELKERMKAMELAFIDLRTKLEATPVTPRFTRAGT